MLMEADVVTKISIVRLEVIFNYYGADGVLQTINGKPLAETEHNYKLTKTVAATCTADGYKEYTCSNCGNVKKEKMVRNWGIIFCYGRA